jgi:Raf kinase inhibitor-like YbhB/YbcL family protein
MSLGLFSSAFNDGDTVPKRYTADGDDKSPPLDWMDPPDGTQSFVIICDDPDAPAGTWDHWVIYDIPGEKNEVEEGIPATEKVWGIAQQGTNDFGNLGYGGPAPPPGKPHRYVFRLYAVAGMTGLEAGASKEEVLSAIDDRVVARAELVGIYQR